MSLIVTKAKLLKLIMEEVESSLTELNPFKTLADQTPEELAGSEEDEESNDLRGSDVLALKGPRTPDPPDPDSWPVLPGRDAIQQAFDQLWNTKYMADLEKSLSPEAYRQVNDDWQRLAMATARQIAVAQRQAGTVLMSDPHADTAAMANPPKKRFGFFDEMIKEELKEYLEEVYTDKQRSWACAQEGGEFEEMCTGPVKKPKTKRGE